LVERPVLSGQIPPVAASYIAREETGLGFASLASQTTTILVPARDTAPGLAGVGGNGKTSLAVALARECHDLPAAHLILWVTATGRDAVITGYAQALRDLGEGPHQGESPDQAADRFLHRLRNSDLPWLVVLDDVAGPAAVDGLWPAGPAGRVLATTAYPDAAAAAPHPRAAELGMFSPREALAYLLANVRLDVSQRAGALDLVTELGFSPVALRLAAAFLAATELDCRQYHTHFAERRKAAAGAFDGLGATVAAAWSLSWDLADQLAPQGLASRALALASMLGPHGIPYRVLFSEAARAYLTEPAGFLADESHVRTVLGSLSRAGLITINDRSPARTVLVHELVQAVTRRYLPAGQVQRAARAAADALAQAWSDPEIPPATAQALRDCTAKLQDIAGAFLMSSECHPALLQAGRSLDAAGLSGPAVTYWGAMARATQQGLGTEHPQTVAVFDLLGAACQASGRFDEAVAVYEGALADTEKALGSAHPDTLAARDRLSRSYIAAGRPKDAIGVAERALASAETTAGPDHPDTLTAHTNLAGAYLGAGLHDDAIAAFRRVLARMESVLGPDHPETIATRSSLAATCRESGRFKEAIALGKRALADTERVNGPGHPDTISARASLAATYRDAKKPKDALSLYQRILADRERLQGPGHPDTILARCDLAVTYLAARKFGLSVPQYERALTDSEQALGPHHPITQSVREDLNAAASVALSVLGIDLRSRPPAKAAPSTRSLSLPLRSGQNPIVFAGRRGYVRAAFWNIADSMGRLSCNGPGLL
jgi:tetratricopeptide (TPR) repeat protein